MLEDTKPQATVAVKDLAAAARFYGETLGLKREPGGVDGEVIRYLAGGTVLVVYRSAFAGTNAATCVTWAARDVDALVKALEARGVKFEDYDMPGMTRQGHVHIAGGMRAAWFKDP